jgi:hypothetical protein
MWDLQSNRPGIDRILVEVEVDAFVRRFGFAAHELPTCCILPFVAVIALSECVWIDSFGVHSVLPCIFEVLESS